MAQKGRFLAGAGTTRRPGSELGMQREEVRGNAPRSPCATGVPEVRSDPRSLERGPIEAAGLRRPRVSSKESVHAQWSVAPLKRSLRQDLAAEVGGDPCSLERGPIEALVAAGGPTFGSAGDPRSLECGPIEAARPGTRSYRDCCDPRSPERGPAEAGSSQWITMAGLARTVWHGIIVA